MGKLKNKLIEDQDNALILAEKLAALDSVICKDPATIRWMESVNRAEANYQASRGNTGGVRWVGD